MSAFVGYIANPGDDASAAAIQNAIKQQPYGVPASVLTFVWQNEAGGASGTAQETGYNYAGFGGFFGLPSNLMGSVQTQVNNAASLLAQQYASFGNWKDAISAYNVGPNGDLASSYGQGYGGGGGAPTGTGSVITNVASTVQNGVSAVTNNLGGLVPWILGGLAVAFALPVIEDALP